MYYNKTIIFLCCTYVALYVAFFIKNFTLNLEIFAENAEIAEIAENAENAEISKFLKKKFCKKMQHKTQHKCNINNFKPINYIVQF